MHSYVDHIATHRTRMFQRNPHVCIRVYMYIEFRANAFFPNINLPPLSKERMTFFWTDLVVSERHMYPVRLKNDGEPLLKRYRWVRRHTGIANPQVQLSHRHQGRRLGGGGG